MNARSKRVSSQSCPALSSQPHGLQPSRLLWARSLPSKDSGVGTISYSEGVFLTQGQNSHLQGLLEWQADSLPLQHLGNNSGPFLSRVIQPGRRTCCPSLNLVEKEAGTAVPGEVWCAPAHPLPASPPPLQRVSCTELFSKCGP